MKQAVAASAEADATAMPSVDREVSQRPAEVLTRNIH
jgi:hypothetical protein